MTDISSVLSALAFFLSIAAAFYSARSVTLARELRDRLSPFPESRLRSLETSQAELSDALTEVANRVKMMKVRGAVNHVRSDQAKSDDPDPHKEPDRWREWMNSRLARARLNGAT